MSTKTMIELASGTKYEINETAKTAGNEYDIIMLSVFEIEQALQAGGHNYDTCVSFDACPEYAKTNDYRSAWFIVDTEQGIFWQLGEIE